MKTTIKIKDKLHLIGNPIKKIELKFAESNGYEVDVYIEKGHPNCEMLEYEIIRNYSPYKIGDKVNIECTEIDCHDGIRIIFGRYETPEMFLCPVCKGKQSKTIKDMQLKQASDLIFEFPEITQNKYNGIVNPYAPYYNDYLLLMELE